VLWLTRLFKTGMTCYIGGAQKKVTSLRVLVIDTTSSKRFTEGYLFNVQEVAEACNIKPIYGPDSVHCLAQAHSIASATP